MTGSECWAKVCAAEDVPFLEGRRVEVGGFYVGVFNTEEGFYAVYDVCPTGTAPSPTGTWPPLPSPARFMPARST